MQITGLKYTPRTAQYYALIVFSIYIWSTALALGQTSASVHVIEAKIGPVTEYLKLYGTITSERSASLSPRVSGLVSKVYVDAGDNVSQGDVLVELDATLAKLALNRADAAINEARVALDEARRLSDEARDLAKSKNIPETTVLARIADVNVKSAVLNRIEAEYRQQAEIIKRHTVVAPFNSTVSRKRTEAGEWVETGTPVIDLVATNDLRLDVQSPQEYFYLIDKQTPVYVMIDAVPGKEFTGEITATVPVNDPNARTFLVRIKVDNAEHFFVPGMSAQAILTINLKQEALILPRDATIQHTDGRNTVWVINNINGRMVASEQQIQLGRNISNAVIVKKGLEPGSLVVIRGNETLQEGQTVQILEHDSAVMN